MPRETHIRNCEELQASTAAHVAVCRCQQALRAWKRTSNPETKNQLRQDYSLTLEALFQLLRADLGAMVHQWLLRCVPPQISASQERQPVIQEVEYHLALNIFTAVVQALPDLILDAKTDLHGQLLAIAQRSLYNHK
jgi:hypothetical protein